jgi:hypothetical protein
MIREAIEHVRASRPLGISIAAGVRFSLNVQHPNEVVHAPWLSTAAALAVCCLATGRVLPRSVGALAVMTGPGVLEQIADPVISPSLLVSAVDWSEVWAPAHVVDGLPVRSEIAATLDELLEGLGFEPVDHTAPGGQYL